MGTLYNPPIVPHCWDIFYRDNLLSGAQDKCCQSVVLGMSIWEAGNWVVAPDGEMGKKVGGRGQVFGLGVFAGEALVALEGVV